MMDVMHIAKSSFSSPQECPIDLTKQKPKIDNVLSPQYPWNAELYRLYPHLRFNNSFLHNPPILEQNQNYEERNREKLIQSERSSAVIQCVPHPKKRPYNEVSENLPEPELKKQRLCDDSANASSSSEANKKCRYSSLSISESFDQPRINLAKYSSPSVPYSYVSSLMPEKEEPVDTMRSKSTLDKETETLMAAVQQSQMLYYNYCTQLFRNLRTNQFLQGQEHYNYLHQNFSNDRACPTFENALNKINLIKTSSSTSGKGISISSINRSTTHKTPIKVCSSPARNTCSPPQPTSTSEERHFFSGEGECHTILGRRRAPRALTGKHVRPGTGASPSTLITLRQKLAEKRRQDDQILPRSRKTFSSKIGRGSRTGVSKLNGRHHNISYKKKIAPSTSSE